MEAWPVSPAELRAGDLVFLSDPDSPETARHVAIYLGGGRIIEAPSSGLPVRRLSFHKRFSREIEKVKPGDRILDRVIGFGRPNIQ